VTVPEATDDVLARILAVLEKQIEDSGTLQKFVLGLSERIDSLGAASASQETELSELRAEIASLEKRLKKAKKKGGLLP
jgi:NH3-dependent NAD+ synthetase